MKPIDFKDSETETTLFERAGLMRRLAALLYDSFLIGAIWLVLGYVIQFIFQFKSNQVVNGIVETNSLVNAITFFMMLTSSSSFYLYFWRRGGQTLGMMSWKIKVVSKAGRPVTIQQGFIRFLYAWPAFFLFGLGYFWLYFDPEKDTLHDKLSQTYIAFVPSKKNVQIERTN